MTTHSGVNFLMGFMVNQIILQNWVVNGVNGFSKKRQITNEFWLDVFNSWKQVLQEPKSNIKILLHASGTIINSQITLYILINGQDKELDQFGIFLMPVEQ